MYSWGVLEVFLLTIFEDRITIINSKTAAWTEICD